MNYALRRLAGRSLTWISLTEAEYADVVSHSTSIFRVLELEEKLDILIGNQEELENELLRISVGKSIHQHYSWHDGARNRCLLNRRVSNLLSSCRLYLDHLRHGIISIFGAKSPEMKTIDDERSRQYDSSFSYRLMEELRNYTQHRRLPIDVEITTHMITAYGVDKQEACAVTPMIKKSYILEDDKIKKAFRLELESQPDTIDLKTHIRNYVQSLWTIHAQLRGLIAPHFIQWENTIETMIHRWPEKGGSHFLALHVVIQSDDEKHPVVQESHPVFLEPIKEVQYLQEQNDLYPTFSTHYVTSQTTERIIQERPNQALQPTRLPLGKGVNNAQSS